MPWTQEELLNRLMELGIDAPTVQHRPIYTVEEGEEDFRRFAGRAMQKSILKRQERCSLACGHAGRGSGRHRCLAKILVQPD